MLGPPGPGPAVRGRAELPRAAVLLGAVCLVAIGVGGVLAELLGRLFGAAFVAGDMAGVTYTAQRCAEFLEYVPDAGPRTESSLPVIEAQPGRQPFLTGERDGCLSPIVNDTFGQVRMRPCDCRVEEDPAMNTQRRSPRPLSRLGRRQQQRRAAAQLGAARVGAAAVGAVAIGAGAVGALAVGRLAVGRAVVRQLKIEDLEVKRLHVHELRVDQQATAAQPATPSASETHT